MVYRDDDVIAFFEVVIAVWVGSHDIVNRHVINSGNAVKALSFFHLMHYFLFSDCDYAFLVVGEISNREKQQLLFSYALRRRRVVKNNVFKKD